jgi:hypothetical protein
MRVEDVELDVCGKMKGMQREKRRAERKKERKALLLDKC